jgi:hypothetical protein
MGGFFEGTLYFEPEEELDMALEMLDEDDRYCRRDALHLLKTWERNDTPWHVRRAEADAFYVKWNFGGPSMPALKRKAFRVVTGGKK